MGFGSVLGSKNVKAIVVKGSKKIPIADPEGVKQVRKKLKEMTGPGFYNLYDQSMPIPGNEVIKKVHCHGCAQGCWRSIHRRPSGLEGIRKCQTALFYVPWNARLYGRPTEECFRAASLANDYSLCIIELSFLLSWLDQCFAQGILTEKEAELPLSQMGSPQFLEAFLEKISSVEGFGVLTDLHGQVDQGDNHRHRRHELPDVAEILKRHGYFLPRCSTP